MDEKFILKSQIKKTINQFSGWADFFKILQSFKWFWKIYPELISLDKEGKLIPNLDSIFRPFIFTSFSELKVCIVGESPYNTNKLATGIAFSSGCTNITPPTLRNIFRELLSCYPETLIETNKLNQWCSQGVFLYNVHFIKSKTDKNNKLLKEWCQKVAQQLFLYLSTHKKEIVYVLLGNVAKNCIKWIKNQNDNLCLFFSHPSPLSAYRSFNNSMVFTLINQFIQPPINWNLTRN